MIRPEVLTINNLLDGGDAGGRPAVVFPERRLTRAALGAEVIIYAKALRALGVGPGDHVGLLLPGSADIIGYLLASARIGAVGVPVNVRFKSVEITYLVENSDMRVLLIAPEFLGLLREALPSLSAGSPGRLHLPEAPMLRAVAVLGPHAPAGTATWLSALGAGQQVPDAEIERLAAGTRPEDPFVILYTSGTTSRPRGCVHTHGSLGHQGIALAERLGLTETDRFWTPLPFFHVGGFDVLLAALAAECPMVHTGNFEPGSAVAQLIGERVTVAFPAFETIWLPILNHPDFAAAKVPELRLVINVGTPERMRLMEEQIPQATQISCTGSTEAAGFCCIGAVDDPPEERAAWAGVPVRGMQGRIVDPQTREEVPDGTPGEMQFRGFSRFHSYYRDPQLTAQRIDADGWYSTGDQLVRDSVGRFRFIGRLSDMLKVGGENVAPADVENYLATHPAVRMVQVVGAPDARYTEVPVAYVELVPGQQATEQELIDFCLGKIATYKVPRYVRFVSEWPMSGTKVQKFRLRERIREELAAAGITEAPKLYSSRERVPQAVR